MYSQKTYTQNVHDVNLHFSSYTPYKNGQDLLDKKYIMHLHLQSTRCIPEIYIQVKPLILLRVLGNFSPRITEITKKKI